MPDTSPSLTGPEPRPPAVPEVPGFVLHDFIGRGSSGMVWRATQDGTMREVALKLLAPWHAHGLAPLRFEREAEISASLEHDAIARVYGAGDCPAGPWLAMELVEGPPADVWVHETQPALRARVEFFRDVCSGISHAHQRAVIHRDLKPGNVLVTPEGRPKIVDFGLARRLSGSSLDVSLTREGDFLGTLAWMPPEQAAGRWDEVDALSDVFALGTILFGLIAGEPPLDGSLPPATQLAAAQCGERRRLREVVPGAPRDLEAIIDHCLAAKKSDRYQSVAELEADVSRWLAGEPVQAPVGAPLYWMRKKLRRHWPAVAAAVVAVLAAAGLGFGYLAGQAQVEQEKQAALRREADQKAQTLYEAQELVTQLLTEMQPYFEKAGHPEWIEEAEKRVEAFPWADSAAGAYDARKFRGRSALVQGDALAGSGNWSAALQAYNRAVENLKTLVEAKPEVPLFREELIQARLGSNRALLELGFHREAFRAGARVLELSAPDSGAPLPPKLTGSVVEAVLRMAEATTGVPERGPQALALARQALAQIAPVQQVQDLPPNEAEWQARLCLAIARLSARLEDRPAARQAAAEAELAARRFHASGSTGEVSARLLASVLTVVGEGALAENDPHGASRVLAEASDLLATPKIASSQSDAPYKDLGKAWEKCANLIIAQHGPKWALEANDRAIHLWDLVRDRSRNSASLNPLTRLNLANARYAKLLGDQAAADRYAARVVALADVTGKDPKIRPVAALDAIEAAVLLVEAAAPERKGRASWRDTVRAGLKWLESTASEILPDQQQRRAELDPRIRRALEEVPP